MPPEFLILGRLQVQADGRPIRLSGRKQRLLLAMLVAHAGERVSCDRLIDGLWGSDGSEGKLHTLRVHVSNLRRLLDTATGGGSTPSVIETVEDGYRLRVHEKGVDRVLFERRVEEGRDLLSQDDHAAAARLLRDALAMWRGPAFGELADEEPVRAEAARLEELRVAALEDRIDADLRLGHHDSLIAELRDLIELHPFRERLHGFLMMALYRAGRQTEALRAYRKLERTLGEELGIVPGPDIRELEERILLQDASLDLPRPPPRSTSNLPASTTTFVGRGEQVSEVKALTGETRLLTLLGPGGVGKTRLALEAATEMSERFPGGIWFVPLAPLRDPALVGQTIADTLEIYQQPDLPVEATLIRRLRDSTSLLILDNCEHLIDAVAALTDSLLQGCPDLRVWTTSREPLGLTGEGRFTIPGLSTPTGPDALDNLAACESIQLFVDRARSAQSRFELAAENAAAVAQICRQLDGIPLAIELAAVRSTILTPQQIAAQLDNRFELLSSGSRTADPRQQTLEATLDWSYELLTDEEQKVLRRLAVFRGSFDLDAAAAVCLDADQASWAALDAVDQLASKSLLMAPQIGQEIRYQALETIRLYARMKLTESGEEGDILARHRDWYASFAAEAGPRLRGADQLLWLRRLEVDHDNLRAAMDRSLEAGDITTPLRIAGSIAWFWFLHSHLAEGWHRLESLLERSRAVPDLARLRVLISAGQFAWEQTKDDQARAWLEEAVQLAREIGSDVHAGWALSYMGLLATLEGRWQDARRLAGEAKDLFQATGRLGGFGFSTWVEEGAVYFAARDAGIPAAQRGDAFINRVGGMLDVAQQIGDRNFLGHLHWSLAIAAHDRGDLPSSAEHLVRAIHAFDDLGNRSCAGHTVDQVAWLAVARDRPKRAARLLASTQAMRAALGIPGHFYEQRIWEHCRQTVVEALAADDFAEAWADGAQMGFEHAVEYALAGLGDESVGANG
jgi:predicted ATPase/DNA-binding SARP family transcriptional activator